MKTKEILETRECTGGCGLRFKCLPASPQTRAREHNLCQQYCRVPIRMKENPRVVCPAARSITTEPEKLKPLKSGQPMREFYTAGFGDRWAQSSKRKPVAASETESGTEKTPNTVTNAKVAPKDNESVKKPTITETKNDSTNGELKTEENKLNPPEGFGGSGMQETENDISNSKEEDDGGETPFEDFIALPLPLAEEKSHQRNVLNDSILHLHGLMKSVAKEAPPNRKYDPDMLNAQCNVAKNLRDMMKLKLEVYKEGRKK